MWNTPTHQLREQLLALNGIGPETADSILLHAAHHPIFVVDAYTRRVLQRHDAVAADAKYDEIRTLVEHALRGKRELPMASRTTLDKQRPEAHAPSAMSTAPRAPLAQVYNQMHGLMVQVGKHYCRKQQPKCDLCSLGLMLLRPVQESSASPKALKQRSPPKPETSRKPEKSRL